MTALRIVVVAFFLQGITWAQDVTDPLCPSDCTIPSCHCPSFHHPGDFPVEETPQFIVLSFDDAVTDVVYEWYERLLFNGDGPRMTNPNDCPIGTTFFVSHEYSNYELIHRLYHAGYEIASHSVSHRIPSSDWDDLTEAEVAEEMAGLREIVANFANIDGSRITGARVPFLQTSGDEYYRALYEDPNFIYDASRPTRKLMNEGLWPFTYDADYSDSLFLDCQIEPCPQGPFPGFWQVPIVDLVDSAGTECAMLDQCDNRPETFEQAMELLRNNFRRHNESPGRSPLGLYTHASWFIGEGSGNDTTWQHNFDALEAFLEEVLAQNEHVWVVSVGDLLNWMRDPMPYHVMASVLPCNPPPEPTSCVPETCGPYPFQGSDHYFQSCVRCPPEYPWVGNPDGTSQTRNDPEQIN